jgi:dsRNA-specific ribonuclease
MFHIFKRLKPIDSISLIHQNKPSQTVSRLIKTRVITLPSINDEKLRSSIIEYVTMKNNNNNNNENNNKNYEFYRFYGDRAYNYFVMRELNLKFPNSTNDEFMKIFDNLVSRNFLSKVVKDFKLDKLLPDVNNFNMNNDNFDEMVGIYCSGMLFNGMEKEMKKFTLDVIDYYFAKSENKFTIAEKGDNQTFIKEKNDDGFVKENITKKDTEVIKENKKEVKPKEIKKYKRKANNNFASGIKNKKLRGRNLLTDN